RGAFGPRFDARPNLREPRRRRHRGPGITDRLRHWNGIAIDASGLDHTPVPSGDPRVFGEQLGPGRSSRALAIVHIAMFDAVNALALGARWGEVTPFVLRSGDQFRVPPPPDLDSREYTAAYNDVKAVGGDGIVTPTVRTADQTLAGIYWAYDGTPTLCAPPRLYNQITLHIAEQRRTGGIELARLLALVNVAMADAGIAIW